MLIKTILYACQQLTTNMWSAYFTIHTDSYRFQMRCTQQNVNLVEYCVTIEFQLDPYRIEQL